jgi:hypothetical protein
MFPMTITLNNPAQLSAVMAALNLAAGTAAKETVKETGVKSPKESQGTSVKSQDKTAPGLPTAGEAEGVAQNATSSSKPQETVASPVKTDGEADGAAVTDYQYTRDIKPLILRLIKGGKRSEAEKLLADFGVDHGEKLAQADYPKFIAAAKAALDEGQ